MCEPSHASAGPQRAFTVHSSCLPAHPPQAPCRSASPSCACFPSIGCSCALRIRQQCPTAHACFNPHPPARPPTHQRRLAPASLQAARRRLRQTCGSRQASHRQQRQAGAQAAPRPGAGALRLLQSVTPITLQIVTPLPQQTAPTAAQLLTTCACQRLAIAPPLPHPASNRQDLIPRSTSHDLLPPNRSLLPPSSPRAHASARPSPHTPSNPASNSQDQDLLPPSSPRAHPSTGHLPAAARVAGQPRLLRAAVRPGCRPGVGGCSQRTGC